MTRDRHLTLPRALLLVLSALAGVAASAAVQPTPALSSPSSEAAAASALAPLTWVEGCWGNTLGEREFREHWMPLRGGVLLGVSHTVKEGRTLSYEFLRFESRPDGVYYVVAPTGQKEAAFKLRGRTVDGTDEIFTFDATTPGFPERVIYRRGAAEMMFTHVEGKVNGEERRNVFPMRRVDCRTGEVVAQ
jgi:hypothetical protein